MKKFLRIISTFIFIFIILIFVLFFLVKYYGDTFLCKHADFLYNQKDYGSAYAIYDTISLYKPEIDEYKYKKTLCLTKMPLSYSVQKKLLEIAQKDDNSTSENLATNAILKFRKKMFLKLGNTYVQDAVHNGIVLRWASFPITYYIEDRNDIPDYYVKETIGAFNDWQRESEDFIKFKQVNNDATAKIVVKFRGNADSSDLNKAQEYKAAITAPVIENEKVLKQMKIFSIIKSHTNEFFSPQQIKTIMAHEIGHALGIWGHSSDNETIMYYSLNNPYDYYENRIDTSLNKKDISTIKLLYYFAPDITDDINLFEQKEKFIYPPMLLSPVDDSSNKAILKAKEILAQNPENIGAALSLADAYNANGKYKESIDLMLFLTEQTRDRNLLNLLFYNIANNYISLKDFDNALFYAKTALALSNNLENKTLVAYIKYCSGNLIDAETEFIYVLSKNPSFVMASLGLADVYIKQKKYLKARQVLKELLKYNPQALDDKNLNTYKVLTMF